MSLMIVTLIVLVFGWIYYFLKKRNNYFKNIGVPYVPPKLFIGNMGNFLSRKEHICETIKYLYNYNKDAKYVGAFDFVQPIFVIRDLELIKSITIKVRKLLPKIILLISVNRMVLLFFLINFNRM